MLQRLSVYRPLNSGVARSLHWTAVSKATTKPKRTRRKVSELPGAYILPNGQPSTPLPAWNDASVPVKPKARRAKEVESIPAAPEQTTEALPARSQLAREIQANLKQFPHCLLLTRVGSFYESYFEQATEIAGLLDIKLTSRRWDGSRVAMCGFPLMHLDKHLKILVQRHKRSVAMCEEFPRQTEFGEKEFERRITRIISPGTLIDEAFLKPSQNNFIVAISLPNFPPNTQVTPGMVGLAWTDVSTGEFYSKECLMETMEDELVRIDPKEIVIDPSMRPSVESHPVLRLLKDQGMNYTFGDQHTPHDIPTTSFTSREEEGAVSLLSLYLRSTLLEYNPSLGRPLHENNADLMHIDAHTIKALELQETDYEDSTRGSLLSIIKRTVTTSGSRLLSRRLCSPSASFEEILGRQALVSFFFSRPHLALDMRETLKNSGDIGRIVQRFLLRKGTIEDLVSLKKTIDMWASIASRLDLELEMEHGATSHQWQTIQELRNRLSDMSALGNRIHEALSQPGLPNPEDQEISEGEQLDETELDPFSEATVPNPLQNLKWIISPNFSLKLSTLYSTMQTLESRKSAMEAQLQSEYNAPSLTLRSSGQQGMHIHLSRARRDQAKLNEDPAFVKLSESYSTKTYVYQPWSQLGGTIGSTALAVATAEKEAFSNLINEILEYSTFLKDNAAVQDELDIALGFATLARELNLVKPTITEDETYQVVNGRHPAVEMGLLMSGRNFTPNTTDMTPSSNFHLITGPNMAGKSTALRQTALIAILAQIGSFVPADSATIGIVDKLFTRIGAKDDLFRDRSTFMVEMMETADILQRATPKSLVIMDEVGRGTTMKDGLAIAFATIHHLVTNSRSRCLFATHFHELSKMLGCTEEWQGEGVFRNVRYYCTGVDELEGERFIYSYQLRKGVNNDSHGLKVARLAGLPESSLAVAKKTLSWLNKNSIGTGLRSDRNLTNSLQKNILLDS